MKLRPSGTQSSPGQGKARRSVVHRGLKRSLDLILSVTVLVLTAPVVAVAAIAVRLETSGPALFCQRRMGMQGRMFDLVKLRSMFVDAAERFPERYAYDLVGLEPGEFYFHDPDDPRVTRVGRILRRWSVDELPNFWNVLRGDMSVVGPRPEIPELAHLYGSDLDRLLSIKPGVTSPAKAAGGDRLSFAETLASDLSYVEHNTLLGDLCVIARTAWAVVARPGQTVRT